MADAPAFDPSKPYEVVEAPPFDPSKPYEARPSSLTEAATTAVRNIPSSAGRFAKDIVQPVIHPFDTMSSLGNLGKGVLEKVGGYIGLSGVPSEHTKYADAIGRFLMNRYGSAEAIRNTLANDPVGMAADVSMVISGGGSAASRLPGMAGRVGKIASAIDPVSAAAKGVGKAADVIVPTLIGDLATHTGAESIRTAARAGYEGGQAGQAFREHMRGAADMGEVVDDARQAVANIRQVRNADYTSGMSGVRQNATVLSFNDIDAAINRMAGIKTYAGQTGKGPPQNLSTKTDAIWREMTDKIYEWKQLDPAEFHTPEGMDALKQQLGDIWKDAPPGTPQRKVAGDIYNAVRDTIVKQVPEYAKVMKGYEEASDLVGELERTMSLKDSASVDTALRKLQSVLRHNVNTNYGQRQKLAEYLVNAGAPHLMEKLAGQAMSSATPRGFGKLIGADILALSAGLLHGGAVEGAIGGFGGLALLPFMSPRVVGETAYYGGKAARPLSGIAKGAYAVSNPLRAAGVDALSERRDDALR